MIPDKNDVRWKKLIDGTLQTQFSFVAASMCVSRNQRAYRMDPTQGRLEKSVEELVTFFTKYEERTKEELSQIFK